MVKDYQRLWRDTTNAGGEAGAIRILAEILAEKEGRDFASCLGRNDAEWCIEILDRGISKYNLSITERHSFFSTLRRLAAAHGRLPGSMVITENIVVEEEILASGGFSDVRCGDYRGHRVAVRALRVAAKDNVPKLRRQFCKEVVLWNSLSHPNVLKLAGVQGDMGKGKFITISEWMQHGNIMEYISHNHVNRLELLHGAAQGLEYLHGANLTHGDLKGANILMSNDVPPRACLADFGFMTMVLDPHCPMSCSAELVGGTTMFMSPELLAPQKFGLRSSTPTPQSDIYAFGLVTFQVLTGELPFRGFGPTGYIISVVEGLRPAKPINGSDIGFPDSLWAFAERCWNADKELRPNVGEVVAHLGVEAADWNGVMPPHAKAEYEAASFEEQMSESMKHFGIFDGIPDVVLEATSVSQAAPTLLSNQSPLSAQPTELSRELEVATPEIKPSGPAGQNEEPSYPHLDQTHESPPSMLPKKKWKPFKSLRRKFRRFFGLSPHS